MPALKKETIRDLVKAYKGDDLAGFLHDAFANISKTKAKIRELQKDEQTEAERHKLALSEISKLRRDVRNECLHYESTYTPDASGNNDSSIDCDICGKTLTRAERQKWIPK